MKKLTFSFFAAILLMMMLAVPAQASTSGDYEFRVSGNSAVITKYTGKEAEPVIPELLGGCYVGEIGESAFAGNAHVTKVVLPATVRRIGDYAFETCGNLREIQLGKALEEIGDYAFSGCGMLATVSAAGKPEAAGAHFPEGLCQIGNYAFYFSGIQNVTFPASLECLGDSAFSNCRLKKLMIPEDTALTEIPLRAFYECQLSEITIPEAVKVLGTEAFAKQKSELQEIHVEHVESIGKRCFAECISGFGIDLTLSATEIADEAFASLRVTKLTLKEGVESIGENSLYFQPTTDEEGVLVIPSTVTTIVPGAFQNSLVNRYEVSEENADYRSVKGILFKKDTPELVDYPKASVSEIVIPAETQSIGAWAFANAMDTEKMTIPASVSQIGDYAFSGFVSQELTLTIPETVTEIGMGAFKDATMYKLKMQASITEIGPDMFRGSSIEELILPDTLESIGCNAFFGANLSTTLPATLSQIDTGAFINARGRIRTQQDGFFATLDENGNPAEAGNFLCTADGTELVSLLRQNKANSKFEKLKLPDGLECIDDYAIILNSIREVRVPDTVTEIGAYALGFSNTKIIPEVYNYNLKFAKTNFKIYTGSIAVADYARMHAISCFCAAPFLNRESITLAGGEQFCLEVSNARPEDVAFTSGNQNIATVDADGLVTAQRIGTASVVATVGHTNFECIVTVTSDSPDPFTPAFDESRFTALTYETYPEWYEHYVSVNQSDISASQEENVFTKLYKNEVPNYYHLINDVETDDPLHRSQMLNEYGENAEADGLTMKHGLNTELARYQQPEDIVVYTGTKELNVITGLLPNIPDLQQCIGNIYEIPTTTSTSLDETIAMGFGDYIMILYIDKEAIGGGYIEMLMEDIPLSEYELLLRGGLKMQVIDAGVRHITAYKFNNGMPQESFERYIKVHVSRELNNDDPTPTPVHGGSGIRRRLFTGTYGNPVTNGTWKYDPVFDSWSYATSETFAETWAYIANPYALPGQNPCDWFYFDEQGRMLTGWQWIASGRKKRCYYLNPLPNGTRGACLLGPGLTPDGWLIDASGAWTVNGTVVEKD